MPLLDNAGGELTLLRPDLSQAGPDYPLLTEDSVAWEPFQGWPRGADGRGSRLVRLRPLAWAMVGSAWFATNLPPSYLDWVLNEHGGTNAINPTADFDANGTNNLYSYAFVDDPGLTFSGTQLIYQRRASADDLDFVVEARDDLHAGSW